MFGLGAVVEFIMHYAHVGVIVFVVGWLQFRWSLRALGATEQLVRDAMKLSPDDPKRTEAIFAIDKTQRAVIRTMRLYLLCLAGLAWVLFISSK